MGTLSWQRSITSRDDPDVPFIRCLLCDFEFPPLDLAICEVETDLGYHLTTLVVTRCHEHNRFCCPACFACQSLAPTAENQAKSRERRKDHGV
jgi:hypothetical protein